MSSHNKKEANHIEKKAEQNAADQQAATVNSSAGVSDSPKAEVGSKNNAAEVIQTEETVHLNEIQRRKLEQQGKSSIDTASASSDRKNGTTSDKEMAPPKYYFEHSVKKEKKTPFKIEIPEVEMEAPVIADEAATSSDQTPDMSSSIDTAHTASLSSKQKRQKNPTQQNLQNNRQGTRPAANKKDPSPKGNKSKAKMVIRVSIALVIVALAITLSVILYRAVSDMFGMGKSNDIKTVTIPSKSSTNDIINILDENEIIEFPMAFKAYIKFGTEGVSFRHGNFNLKPAMSYDEIISALQKNADSNETVNVTIVEGKSIVEIAKELEAKDVCSAQDFINAVNTGSYNYDFLQGIDHPELRQYKLEGYIFPDTYTFYIGSEAKDVVKKFLDNFNNKFTPEMKSQADALHMTIDQIVSLAAIVQAEAPDNNQMKNVASVYWNRLNNVKEYPSLQSCPTRNYAEDILAPNGAPQTILDAYNTYNTQGLPVGPINNPGIEAIRATLNPASSNYYFFCTNLTTGEFYYATTYPEHQANLKTAGLTETPAQ